MPQRISLEEYQVSNVLFSLNYPFNAIIAAAMRAAPEKELWKLRKAFPYIYYSLIRRLHEMDGKVEGWDE